jgi:zinc transport system substrate-binding protein
MPVLVARPMLAALLISAAPALGAPRVAVDVAPVHSIVAAVMAGAGAPDLLMPPGLTEHGYGLKPSEAAALAEAEVVVWVGPGLTPSLGGTLDALAPEARRITLLEEAGLRLLPLRENALFEAHDDAGHDDEEQAGHGDGHDESGNDHAVEEHAGDPAHGKEHGQADEHGHDDGHADDGSAHDHGLHDPHVWLDPRNASAFAAAVAAALAEADPANAALYAANAAAFAAETQALEAELAPRLEALRGRPFFVFHDAYQYFEDRFGLPAAGAIALSDAEPPRAQRLAEIRDRFTDGAIDCVFAEPQFDPRLIATVIEGTATRTGTLDPLGAALSPGPGLYPALLRGLADGLTACLEPPA